MAAGMARRGRLGGKGRWIALLVVLAVGLPLAWYPDLTPFIDRRVDEAFPLAAAPTGTPVPPATARSAPAAVATPTAVPAAVAAISTAAPAASPLAAVPTPTAPAPTAPALPAPTATATGPIAIGSGRFTVVDTIHKGAGTATIYRLPDGRRILRFEDFTVTNGPDLFVYLSGHAEPRGSEESPAVAGFGVARLGGNAGDQNDDLPAEGDLARLRTVMIARKRFATVFSPATLVAGRDYNSPRDRGHRAGGSARARRGQQKG